MAVEGGISEVEDLLPPLTRDARSALQQSAQANAKTDDIENRLRRNNVERAHLQGLFPLATHQDLCWPGF